MDLPITWIARFSTASFCAGASVANLTCLIAARDALLSRAGWDVGENGLFGAPEIPVFVSDECHVSVDKALRQAGFGRQSIVRVATDSLGRIRADRMPAITKPALVVLQAGNVNTGHSDPFEEIIPQVQRSGGVGMGTEHFVWLIDTGSPEGGACSV